MRVHAAAVVCGLLPCVAAQTFVVDAANGPGAHFTQISQAVAAVPDGAVLRVRPGSYNNFSIVGKSMKVLADPGVRVFNPIVSLANTVSVTGLSASQTVLLQGLELRSGYPGTWPRVYLGANLGAVLLDGLKQPSGINAELRIVDCAGAQVSRHQAGGQLKCTVQNSTVTFDRTSHFVAVGSPLVVTGGSVELVGCTVQGGLMGSVPGAPVHALELHGASARIVGTSTLGTYVISSECIGGTGTVTYDPQTTFVGGAPLAAGIVAQQRVLPHLQATQTTAQVQATLSGPAGSLGMLAIGINAPPLTIPGIDGALWLDAATVILPAFGVLAAGQPVTATLPWTPGTVPAVRAVWHGVVLDTNGQLSFSNPSLTILP